MRAVVGAVGISLVFLAAILAPLLTPYDPFEVNLTERTIPPIWLGNGSLSHPLGTDQLGRDVWTRVVHGSRISVVVIVGGLALSGVLGTALGFIFGYCRGFWDGLFEIAVPWYAAVILRVVAICCAATIMLIIGTGLVNLIVVSGLVTWPRYAKVICLRINTSEPSQNVVHPLDAAVDAQESQPSPNSLVAVVAPQLGFQVICESALNFLGIGVEPPLPSWGLMVASGRGDLGAWWISVFPLAAILALVISFYILGSRTASTSCDHV